MAKDERTLETRQRILAAACEVIAEVGFEKIRMRMVAEHAGVSTALLHYHFENRERLFAEAMTHSFAQTGTELERDADTVPASVVLARILHNMLPTDAGAAAGLAAVAGAVGAGPCATRPPSISPSTCTTSCTPGSARRSGGASGRASSPTAMSRRPARCCSP